MTSALSWIIFGGNALISLLILWGSLRSEPHYWPSFVGGCVMFLVALLTSVAYAMVFLSAERHSSWFPLFLPLASSALIVGGYILTAPHPGLTLLQRALLVTFLVLTGVNLLGLFLADL